MCRHLAFPAFYSTGREHAGSDLDPAFRKMVSGLGWRTGRAARLVPEAWSSTSRRREGPRFVTSTSG